MMVDKASEIRVLIMKQLRDELSQEEVITLQSWIAESDHNRALYEELTHDDTFHLALKEYIAFRRLAEAGRKEADRWPMSADWNKVNEIPMPAVSRPWFRYVAAASVLIMLSVVGFLLFKLPAKQLSKVDNNKLPTNNIPAGRDGAVLTLSDGKQIVLDSAANGKLAEQGTATITHKDGRISYKAGNAAKGKVLYNTTSTPRGRQYKLQLSDGTDIWLNAASSVTYPTSFTGDRREISITGEVYLSVMPDKTKPFLVHITGNNSDIEVLGTRFAVNAYADEPYVRTTLLEGSVKLIAQVQGKSTSTILKPGNQLKVSHENLDLIKEANTEEAIAFMNGFFYFDHADIRTVMRQLEKWYDVQVSFTQPVSTRTFDGEIQRNLSLPVVLKILERNGVQFRVEGSRVVVQ